MLQFEPGKAPITLTAAAVERAKYLIEKSEDKKILGLRVGVKSTGCSGLSYFVEYATEQKKFEDKVEESGVTLFIDPTAVRVDGVGEVEVVLTWEPPWTQDRMTEDAKLILNIY